VKLGDASLNFTFSDLARTFAGPAFVFFEGVFVALSFIAISFLRLSLVAARKRLYKTAATHRWRRVVDTLQASTRTVSPAGSARSLGSSPPRSLIAKGFAGISSL